MMAAETYFDAEEAFAAGFASEVIPNKGIDNLDTTPIRNRWTACPDHLITNLEKSAVDDSHIEALRRRVAVHSQFRG
jgi:enoyl-CoA hydratase/carnithine racemase